jgi:hypothetical protein
MTDIVYPLGREGFLGGEIDFDTGTIKALLLRGYTYSAAHKFVSDLTGGGGGTIVATVTLASKTITAGVADCADWTWPAVPTGAACSCFVVVQTSAPAGGADLAAGAQRLIAFYDSQTGLPVTPNTGDIAYQVDNGANKLFAL